jgi:hypothetical protein
MPQLMLFAVHECQSTSWKAWKGVYSCLSNVSWWLPESLQQFHGRYVSSHLLMFERLLAEFLGGLQCRSNSTFLQVLPSCFCQPLLLWSSRAGLKERNPSLKMFGKLEPMHNKGVRQRVKIFRLSTSWYSSFNSLFSISCHRAYASCFCCLTAAVCHPQVVVNEMKGLERLPLPVVEGLLGASRGAPAFQDSLW